MEDDSECYGEGGQEGQGPWPRSHARSSLNFLPHITFCDMEYKNTRADGGLDLVISHFHLKSKLKEIIKMMHVSITGWRYPFL